MGGIASAAGGSQGRETRVSRARCTAIGGWNRGEGGGGSGELGEKVEGLGLVAGYLRGGGLGPRCGTESGGGGEVGDPVMGGRLRACELVGKVSLLESG